MRRWRRSVTELTTSARAREASAILACTGASMNSRSHIIADCTGSWPAERPRASSKRAGQLLGAHVILVAVLDLPPAEPALVEPGPVRGAEGLDEPGIPFADDGGVLAAHLSRVDDQVAVLAPPDQEPVLLHAPDLLSVGGEQHDDAARRGCLNGILGAPVQDRGALPRASRDAGQIQARRCRVLRDLTRGVLLAGCGRKGNPPRHAGRRRALADLHDAGVILLRP